MKHIWTVLCQNSSIDYESNLVSIFNCLEEINFTIENPANASAIKIIIPDVQLVSYWLVESGNDSLETRTEFLDSEGVVLNTFENNLPVKNGLSRFRNRTNIQGIPVNKGGRYFFRVSVKTTNGFETVTQLPLDVNITFKVNSQIKSK